MTITRLTSFATVTEPNPQEHRGDGRRPPYDQEAERSLLGAMMLTSGAVQVGVAEVEESDFFDPRLASVYAAVVSLHAEGSAIDPTTVADLLRRRGQLETVGGMDALRSMVVQCPSTSSASRYASIIADHAVMRLLVAAGGRIVELGYSRPSSVGDAVGEAGELLQKVQAGVPQVEVFVSDLDSVCDRPETEGDVVIPGLLHRGDRMLLVAGEGAGKSMVLRQLAIMAAQGLHPFRLHPTPPVRSLLVDLENPESTIRRTCRPMLAQARRTSQSYDPGRSLIFHHPEGLDIRSRAGFGALDSALSSARPDLVCLGPLYKLYRAAKGEQAEDVAMDVTSRLDDLRSRHRFALVMEHHAPHGQAGGARDMRPFGSSVWQRWPEFGPALVPVKRNDRRVLAWSEWRPPREIRDWPVKLERGTVWPWDAVYEGTASAEGPPMPDPPEPDLFEEF